MWTINITFQCLLFFLLNFLERRIRFGFLLEESSQSYTLTLDSII